MGVCVPGVCCVWLFLPEGLPLPHLGGPVAVSRGIVVLGGTSGRLWAPVHLWGTPADHDSQGDVSGLRGRRCSCGGRPAPGPGSAAPRPDIGALVCFWGLGPCGWLGGMGVPFPLAPLPSVVLLSPFPWVCLCASVCLPARVSPASGGHPPMCVPSVGGNRGFVDEPAPFSLLLWVGGWSPVVDGSVV